MPYFFCLCTEIISVSRIGTFLALTRDYGFDYIDAKTPMTPFNSTLK
jgi:hypothetical protein